MKMLALIMRKNGEILKRVFKRTTLTRQDIEIMETGEMMQANLTRQIIEIMETGEMEQAIDWVTKIMIRV